MEREAVIIRDAWIDPPPMRLPSFGELLEGMFSENPVTAARSVRMMRALTETYEMTALTRLMTEPGMSPGKAAGILGRSNRWVTDRLSPLGRHRGPDRPRRAAG